MNSTYGQRFSVTSLQLWRWAFADQVERMRIMADLDGLPFSLEYDICELLYLSPFARRKNWWCDGVVDIAVNRVDRTSFQISGAAWNPGERMEFQLEYNFGKERDVSPIQIAFQFGRTDRNGRIQKYPPRRIDQRSTTHSDQKWVIDMTISPPER